MLPCAGSGWTGTRVWRWEDPTGPTAETERLELYQRYAEQLLSQKDAYRCYCTEEELAAEREALLAEGALSGYSGRCRNLSPEDCARLEAEGRKPAIRFRVPDNQGTIVVRDLVRGEVSFDCSDIGDFIILKSDGIPTYNFAVVVDDHCMSVSRIGRRSTSQHPRQILLYNALGWETPVCPRVPIPGKDRSKMSKRHGATAIEQYQERATCPGDGQLPALLGWSAGGGRNIFPRGTDPAVFPGKGVQSPAVFDLDKLNWLNGHHIRQSP